MLTKLLTIDPTNVKEVRAALTEAIKGFRSEAQHKLTDTQADPAAAASSVKEHMAKIETLSRAAREMQKLEAAATKIMQKVARLQKPAQ